MSCNTKVTNPKVILGNDFIEVSVSEVASLALCFLLFAQRIFVLEPTVEQGVPGSDCCTL